MGKVSKEKVSKKSVKRSSEAAEEAPHVIYDDDDDEEEEKEANISSEEEEEEENERRRHKLLEAISALGGRRKRPLGERSEAAVQMSEFTVSAEGGGGGEGGVQLSDLIGSLDQNPEVPNKTKKQLKNLQHGRTVESPLSRQQSERIQRDVAFQKAAAEVTRWKSLIQQNQRAEQLVFPLQREASGPRAMERVVTGWKAHTPLEQEVFALLSANQQPIHDPILTPAEEASLRAMSLEDAKIRRAELQKARALQSYYEAKARRERKIKSKKYHKVQNKSKRKEFLKKFDDMVKADPAAALQELNRIELARMQERMSLKHQNSGKWAKSKAIMAKYDESARKAMQQQLEVNKELTQKLVTPLSNEQEEAEEEEEEEEAEVLPEFVNDAERGLNSSNPWMRGKLSEEPAETEKNDAVELTAAGVKEQQQQEEEEEEEEVVETEEEALLRQFDSRRKQRQAQEAAAADDDDDDEDEDEVEERKKEEEELSEFTSLYREMADTEAQQTEEEEEEGIRTEEDVELLGQEESAADEAPAEPPTAQSPPPGAQKAGKNRKRKRGIELKKVLTKEARVIQVPLAPTVEDSEEESEERLDQRGLIKEAFAGDDVVSDFLKEKRQQEGAGKPKVVDLTLPGWGEWGGTGLKPSRTKRRRFRTKMAPPPPRKDQKLPSVIISEARNSSISLHQVNSLPGPFQNHAQFEGTIRCPLGRTWNTERTVKKITKPRVVTQLGAIIEPMAREELMKGSKSGADRKRKH